jgi:type VII secretion protein EccE
VTVRVAEHPPGSVHTGPQGAHAGVRPALSAPGRRPILGIRAGQVVVAQVAAALLIAAAGHGPVLLAAAALGAAAALLVAWGRLRHRWVFEWLAIGVRYATRQHTLAPSAGPGGLLGLIAPGAEVIGCDLGGDAAAVVSDRYGVTAVLELGDPNGLLAEAAQPLPSPASLLPAPGPDSPPMRIRLLLHGAPAPALSAGGGTAATSYRQLTDGRLLGQERVLLTLTVLRAEDWSESELRRALSGAVRKVRRRLGPVPARPLGDRATLGVLAELAHHDDAQPVRESWQLVNLGGLAQSTFQLRRWPDLRAEAGRRLAARLLALPASTITVSLGAGPWPADGTDLVPADLTVRLAAPTPTLLAGATQTMRRLLAADGAGVRRLDGEQLIGLAATLPLGATVSRPVSSSVPTPLPSAALAGLDLPTGTAGLMLGANRHGAAILARLFRAEATRVMLIGGMRPAQLIALRAMALGAQIVVQTARPRAWEPFVRGVSVPGQTIPVIPPGRPVGGPAGTPLRPLLVVVDVGPVAADQQPGPGWCATLVVRDELAEVDADALSRADLVILQPLRPDEATLAGAALGLGDSAEWLTRIRDDMVGLVSRRVLRWALLSATPIESQLVGPPARH